MDTKDPKTERIELRLSSSEKALIKRAQEISGDKSLSSFTLRVLKQQAAEIISQNEELLASEEDRIIFYDAVFADLQPNQTLMEAAAKYKSKSS